VHSILVSRALEKLGTAHQRLFVPNLPQKGELSYSLDDSKVSVVLRGATEPGSTLGRDTRTVWFRRVGRATPGATVHPADAGYSASDWSDLIKSLKLWFVDSGCFCINDPRVQLSGSNKAYQLAAAREAGLTIPDTLITNSEDDALRFIESNRARGRPTVVKPFSPMLWYTETEAHVVCAEVVESTDVLHSNLRAGPAIFQALVQKAHEVRVAVMGRTMIASRHEIPEDQRGKLVDFRMVSDWASLKVAPIAVPQDVCIRIAAFMSALGLVFGSIDFLVGPDGEWTFLEINEQGNFLWQEFYSPETPILDAFCKFVASGSADFEYDNNHSDSRVRLEDLKKEFDLASVAANEKEVHIPVDVGVGVREDA